MTENYDTTGGSGQFSLASWNLYSSRWLANTTELVLSVKLKNLAAHAHRLASNVIFLDATLEWYWTTVYVAAPWQSTWVPTTGWWEYLLAGAAVMCLCYKVLWRDSHVPADDNNHATSFCCFAFFGQWFQLWPVSHWLYCLNMVCYWPKTGAQTSQRNPGI